MTELKLNQNKKITLSRRDIVTGLAAGTLVACTTNPETGRSQLMLISSEQLAQLSASSWTSLKQQERVSNNPAYNAQLQRVGDRVTRAAGQGDRSWEYAVFDNDSVNAFVLPGRQVGFYEGLMDFADNDDEIATVMGHEVGHVTARHAAERASQQLAAQGVLLGANIAAAQADSEDMKWLSAALGVGLQFGVILPFSRKHELEADALGVEYMARAGYRPSQALRFWEKMAAGGSGNRPPAYLSTHPAPETRMRALDALIRQRGYA